ncbi:MAG: alpha/beta hydrolase [Chloroflexi bacterium]|nr:alpha/beta hydrolase [Chloroflexota bacterium]
MSVTHIELTSATLEYESEGRGPALVFAHGAGGNRLSWWQQVPALRDRYTCITFSHPGFGSSTWTGNVAGTVEFSAVLSELLDRLEVDRVALVAQSMGGWTCLPLALQQPNRVAALVMASTPGNLHTPEIDEAREASRGALESLRRAWDARSPGSSNPAVGARCLREQPALHYLYSAIQGLNPPRSFEDRVRIGPRDMAEYQTPTMYVIGEEDVVLPPPIIEAAARITPGARLERVPQAGHSVYFERPSEFNEVLAGFLRDVYPS